MSEKLIVYSSISGLLGISKVFGRFVTSLLLVDSQEKVHSMAIGILLLFNGE